MSTNDQWEEYANLYKAYFEDSARDSFVNVLPRLLHHYGEVKGKSFLDLGCGQGRFSRVLHDRGAEVTAYDAAPSEIEIARSLDDKRGVLYSSDKMSLEREHYYALILCSMVFLCNPPQRALQLSRSIYNALAYGGTACLVNTNTEKLGYKFKDFYSIPPDDSLQGEPYQTIIATSKGSFTVTDHYYSPEHLKDIFSFTGFEVLHEEIISEQFVLHVLTKRDK